MLSGISSGSLTAHQYAPAWARGISVRTIPYSMCIVFHFQLNLTGGTLLGFLQKYNLRGMDVEAKLSQVATDPYQFFRTLGAMIGIGVFAICTAGYSYQSFRALDLYLQYSCSTFPPCVFDAWYLLNTYDPPHKREEPNLLNWWGYMGKMQSFDQRVSIRGHGGESLSVVLNPEGAARYGEALASTFYSGMDQSPAVFLSFHQKAFARGMDCQKAFLYILFQLIPAGICKRFMPPEIYQLAERIHMERHGPPSRF